MLQNLTELRPQGEEEEEEEAASRASTTTTCLVLCFTCTVEVSRTSQSSWDISPREGGATMEGSAVTVFRVAAKRKKAGGERRGGVGGDAGWYALSLEK